MEVVALQSRPWLKKLVSAETNGKSLISISSCKNILFPLLLSQQAEKGQRSGSTIQGSGEIAALWYSRVENTLEHHCSYCMFFIKKYFIIKMHQTDTDSSEFELLLEQEAVKKSIPLLLPQDIRG